MRSGEYTLNEAVTLDDLAEASRAGELARHLHPLETALRKFTRVPVEADQASRLMHGQFIPCPIPPAIETGYAVDASDTVVAILAYSAAQAAWRPDKVFGAGGLGIGD